MKRLRATQIKSFEDYLSYVEHDKSRTELSHMIDAITTNKTSFFRENVHFSYLRDNVLPSLNNQRMRFWSAGCSSGEEPFSLAILLREAKSNIDSIDARILATDVSMRMLQKAHDACYEKRTLRELPCDLLKKYFTLVRGTSPAVYQVNTPIRKMVRVAKLNLMHGWPMRGPFDVIFCRNVMIYFDGPTRERLVNRFWELLGPDGILIVGHSESLSSISHNFRYIQPAVYKK